MFYVLTTPCLGPSLQLHASDIGLTRATEIGWRRLTAKLWKNFMEKMKITKERDFQNSAVLQNFEKIPTNYLVG